MQPQDRKSTVLSRLKNAAKHVPCFMDIELLPRDGKEEYPLANSFVRYTYSLDSTDYNIRGSLAFKTETDFLIFRLYPIYTNCYLQGPTECWQIDDLLEYPSYIDLTSFAENPASVMHKFSLYNGGTKGDWCVASEDYFWNLSAIYRKERLSRCIKKLEAISGIILMNKNRGQ